MCVFSLLFLTLYGTLTLYKEQKSSFSVAWLGAGL